MCMSYKYVYCLNCDENLKIHHLFVVLCLLDWQSVPNLLWKKTSERFTFISSKNVFKRRTVVLIRRKVVVTMLESALSMASNLIGTLLLMSGDIELNPGPGRWRLQSSSM